MTDIGKRIKELRNERDLTISDYYNSGFMRLSDMFVI